MPLFISKMLRDNIFAISILAIGFLANFIVSLLFSNLLGARAFGDYRITINVLQFSATIALLGSNQSIYKFLPIYVVRKELKKIKGFILGHFKLLIMVSIIFMLVSLCIIGLIVLLDSKQNVFESRYYHPSFIIVFVAPLLAILMFASAIIRSLGHNIKAMLPSILVPTVILLIAFFLSLEVKNITLMHALFLFTFALIVAATFECYLVYRIVPKKIWSQSEKYHFKQWWGVASKLLMSNLAFIGMELVELILLKVLTPRSINTGLYSAILIICSIVFLVRQGVGLVMSPLISPLAHRSKLTHLESVVNRTNMLITPMTVIVGFVLAYYQRDLLLLFGGEYVDVHVSLYVMLLATVIGSSCSLSVEILMYSNYQNAIFKINLISLLVTIILCLVLIPLYGLLGAAIAFFVSRLIVVSSSIIFSRRKLGIKSYFFI